VSWEVRLPHRRRPVTMGTPVTITDIPATRTGTPGITASRALTHGGLASRAARGDCGSRSKAVYAQAPVKLAPRG
jgi:hypothetical protein